MKKSLSFLLAMLMAVAMIPAGILTASAEQEGDYTYSVADSKATITKYTGAGGDVTIPGTLGTFPVTVIGDNAFEESYGLTSVSIPDSVISLGKYAFYYCIDLTSVVIGSSVQTIGDMAFSDCPALTTMAAIPDSVTTIGERAFQYCSGLTSLTIGNGVQTIGSQAFYECSGMTSLTIGTSVKTITNYAFAHCTGLTSLTIPNNVTEIGEWAFGDCAGLTSLAIGTGVITIGGSAFYSCTGLTDVIIPDNVTQIGYSAFADSGLSTLTIGTGLITIAEFAFSGTAWYNSQPDGLIYAGKIAYKYKGAMPDNTVITLKTDTKSIADAAFSDCSGLTGITIPDSVTKIGQSAFYCCTGLTSLTIPDSMTEIGQQVFYGCAGLTSLTIPDSVTAIGVQAFYRCTGLISLTLGSGVTTIGDSAFSTCTGLTEVTIPGNVTAIGNCAFNFCTGLTQINVDGANLFFESVDGVLFNVEKTTLLLYPGGKPGAYAVPPGVTAIGDNAFSGGTGLTSFTFPASVTVIGDYAFGNCTGLTTVTIPDSVTTIMDSAFRYCDGITSLNIGNGVAAIPDSAFCDCDGLTEVTIPRSVTSIGDYAFENCSSLTSVTFLNSQTTISETAFEQSYDVKIYGYKNSGALTYAKDMYIDYSILQKIALTKTVEGFKVNIKENMADHKYQIWSYQKITSDFFADETANQWILSKAYTLGSSGDAIIESDGSISFIIDAFTSPDVNYTIAVREIDENNTFAGDFRDTFTPAEVQEVKITKVLIDGGYSDGHEIMEVNYWKPYIFKVIGNGVPNTTYTAKVLEGDSALPAISANEFSWDTSTFVPNNYSIELTAANEATTDTKIIKIHLTNMDNETQYGNISSLTLTPDAGNTVPKNVGIAPSFTNGSFWYRVSEPCREAFFTSGLFSPSDTIQYSITKFGIYQVFGFVNRENEFKIGNYYDDGMLKTVTISRSETEPSSVALNANVDITKPVEKYTPIVFTATADIGGIGSTPVQYSFWRYDAKGYILIKDWSSSNTLDWSPALIGIYTIEVRVKGEDAGSYEAANSVRVNVTYPSEQIAQGVIISINEDELNANVKPRAPIAVKASATSTNDENLLYKFYVTDEAMGTSMLQNYSANQECVWTPRKAGTYTMSVLIKNDASFGAYDAIKTFEITVSAPLD